MDTSEDNHITVAGDDPGAPVVLDDGPRGGDDGGDDADAGATGPESSEATVSTGVTRSGSGRTRRDRRRGRRWPWLVAVPVVIVVLVVGAWGVDSAMGSERVARNTELAGVAVGGMSTRQLASQVEALGNKLPTTPVHVQTPDLTLETTAGDLGVTIDAKATEASVMDTGRSSGLLSRPWEWARSFVSPRPAEVSLSVDRQKLAATVTALEGDRRKAAVEPTLVDQDGKVVLKAGVNGVELDPSKVVAALPATLGDLNKPIVVSVERTVVPPKVPDSAVKPLVDEANRILGARIDVKAGEQSFTLEGKNLTGSFTIDDSSGKPALSVSDKAIGMQLLKQLPSASANPTGVRFDIPAGGAPVPVPGHDAQVCCGDGAATAIVAALREGKTSVEVPTRTMTAAEGVAWANTLGVKEITGQFTTPHACCEPRVTNIHRMADTVRGTLIPPGATFSVNDTVGKRTAEKGYVSAPQIVDHKHTNDIGGGVSQFATTTFNAAFFGGYDIPAYQMHSEYISRYPYGREATLFYPSVDLKIHNNSPYGVVIWPTYTGTSLTVQLWSTRYGTGQQTWQNQSSGCGSVTTERTRTYPDGRSEKDRFHTNYDCNPG